MLLSDEEESNKELDAAIREADKNRDRREAFCFDLEKKVGISGFKWTVDFTTGILTVGEKRP